MKIAKRNERDERKEAWRGLRYAAPFARLHARLAVSTMLVTAVAITLSYVAGEPQNAPPLPETPARFPNALWAAASDIAGTAFIALLIGWVAGIVAARPLVRRLERLTEAAHEWAEGRLDRRVNDEERDELATLARRLDAMAYQLEQTFALRQTLAVARERERLALELHDGVKQQMFALALHLGAARAHRAAPESSGEAALDASLEAAYTLAGQSQRDLLRLVQAWSEPETGGERRSDANAERTLAALAFRLRDAARTWEGTALAVFVTVSDGASRFLLPPGGAARELEGVAREALANAARHARAARVVIALDVSAPSPLAPAPLLRMSVTDDGCGFVGEGAPSGGLGLTAMRERAARLPGGALEIESAPGRGCRVTALCRLDFT